MRRALAVALAVLILAVGCGRSGGPVAAGSGSGSAQHSGARFSVVAAENFWGSLAAQLAGAKASVRSIIVNPATDPHSYQPSAADARTLAGASLVIVNGAGYDKWASQLLQASPDPHRVVLDVGTMLGVREGQNPHRWYYPGDVHAVIAAMTADYQRLDPGDAAYFAQQRQTVESTGLSCYEALRRQIRERWAGTPVGYSESIFQGLGEDLHLKLLTPYTFVKAIAEGTEVTASDRSTVDAQASRHQIRVWVFNKQNVTPDVQRVNQIAREQRIPIATVTETLDPPADNFQQWQCSQLEGLSRALAQSGANAR
jgi:zinc/manganese transport system substrate-binding protein